MFRHDRDTWVELLDSAYKGWARQVLRRLDEHPPPPSAAMSKEYAKAYYHDLIHRATDDELQGLDLLFVERQQARNHRLARQRR